MQAYRVLLLSAAMATLGPISTLAAAPDRAETLSYSQAVAQTAPAEAPPPTAEFLLANHANVSPVNLIYVVNELWGRGDRLQAAFWFYVWQIRTTPWAEINAEFMQVRSELNAQIGATINRWLGSDIQLWKDTIQRAIQDEARLPLWNQVPEGLTPEAWSGRIANARAQYAQETFTSFANLNPDEVRASRAAAGLPNGPLLDAGSPLPSSWR